MSDFVTIDSQDVEYEISSLIEDNHLAIEHAMRGGVPVPFFAGPKMKLDPDKDVYPANDQYQFQEWPAFVFEIGGYGDMTMVDPYTLHRLWVADAFHNGRSVWDAMRFCIDVAEHVKFPGKVPVSG
jgi:hypothetical protein